MKSLSDLIPVILFFLVFWFGETHADTANALANQYLGALMSGGVVVGKNGPVILATAVAIVATIIQVAFELARRKPVGPTLWTSSAVIIIFGGLTIYFNNDNFIKLKPTILYWCFAGGLAISRLFFKKNAIRSMSGGQISLPEHVWNKLDLSSMIFFVCMGFLNLFVAFVLFKGNIGAWVNFKLTCIGITFVFALVQAIYLSKHLEEPK